MGSTNEQPRLRHIPALDGLRGIAVAGVLAFHADSLTGGYLGVDLFFVLSGFLITSLLLVEYGGTGGIALLAFWARRARRLLPALFGVLIAVALYAAFVAAPTERGQIRWDAIATLGYVANWRAVLAGSSYWQQFVARSPLEHTWSLAIEEQFYLVWPLVVFGVLRWRKGSVRAVLAIAIGLACASGIWLVVRHTPGSDPTRVYFGTDTRAAGVLLGAALAAWLVWRGPVQAQAARVGLELVGWCAALGLAWAWFNVDGRGDGLYQGGLFLAGLAVVAVIAAVSHPRPGPLAAVFSFAPLRALGIISYGTYLWHWPIYVALSPDRTGLDGIRLTALRVACTMAVATASYFALERPIRRGTFRAPTMRVVVPVAVAGVLGVVLVGTLGATSLAAGFRRDALPTDDPPEGVVRLMVVGDSVAASLAGAMRRPRRARSEVVNRAIAGCVFVRTRRQYDLAGRPIKALPCSHTWTADVAGGRPDVVVIAMSGSFGPADRSPCDRSWDRAFRRSLKDGITTFRDWNARVVLANSAYPVIAAVPPEVARRRIDCVNRVERQVAAETGVELVDLNAYLCPGRVCRLETAAGEQLRPDGVHFDPAAGPTVGRWLLGEVMSDDGKQ